MQTSCPVVYNVPISSHVAMVLHVPACSQVARTEPVLTPATCDGLHYDAVDVEAGQVVFGTTAVDLLPPGSEPESLEAPAENAAGCIDSATADGEKDWVAVGIAAARESCTAGPALLLCVYVSGEPSCCIRAQLQSHKCSPQRDIWCS
jgi:hypothetical protein